MRRRLVILGTATLLVMGAHIAPAAASSPDRPTVTSISVSPTHPQVGDTVTVDAKAFDHGSVDYFVYILSSTPLQVTGMTCIGTPAGPSPDGPSCEYDSNTTTTRAMTDTILTFLADTPGDLEITACAVIAGDPPETGDCRTVDVTVR
jgi:hypothetical protein